MANRSVVNRKHNSLTVTAVRALSAPEIANLAHTRRAPMSPIVKLRQSHHLLAWTLAAGKSQTEAARLCGMSATRVGTLIQDPTFSELLARCSAEVIAARAEAIITAEAEFGTLQVMNRNMAERQLMDHMEDAEESGKPLPPTILNRIAVDRMDRSGYGRHTTTTNLNIGFAAKLEAAINRSRKLAAE